MSSNRNSNTFSETKRDFQISWQMLKSNYKAFVFTEIFAVLAFIFIIFIMILILSLISLINPLISMHEYFEIVSNNLILSHIFRFFFALIAFSIFYAFLNSQHGLAYDIMSSGEMFAEFKGSFTYFKRFWWQYPLLTFIIFIINMGYSWGNRGDGPSPYFLNNPFDISQFIFGILKFIAFFFWFITLIHTFPSITSHGSFKGSFVESFRIFKNNFKRIFSTWGIFFLIFIIPGMILTLFSVIFQFIFLYILSGVYFIFIAMIGFPMLSLLAKGIYNNAKFQHFQPYPEKEAEDENLDQNKK